MQKSDLGTFVESVTGRSHLRIEKDFGDGFVRLRTSEAERRQAIQDIKSSEDIILELLRNSYDAHARNIFIASYREGEYRCLVVIDDGDGIPPAMHEHVFEPRVTSKLDTSHRDKWGYHGRGMALYSISENASSAIVATSDIGLGCSMVVRSNSEKLPEKKDQSSFPTFELTESGMVNVRGPKNIMRIVCEFALEVRNSCSLFIGSPTEIASTLFNYGVSSLTAVERAFAPDVKRMPLVKRLSTCGDPDTFAQCAQEIGLDLSDRSARRILDGEIPPVQSILDRVVIVNRNSNKTTRSTTRHVPKRMIALSKQEREELKAASRSLFSSLAQRYYLESDIDPSIRIRKESLTISIPLIEKDEAE